MSSWGTGLLEDDLALDVYDDYMTLFDSKKDHSTIRRQLENKYSESIENNEEKYFYWLAFAKAQWECGALENDILQKVTDFIDSEESLEQWGDKFERNYISRKQKLSRFKRTISKPKSQPRAPKKFRFISAYFKAGDCLTFKLPDGRYGAALVLDVDNSDKKEGSTLCGLLDYVSHELPPQNIYETASWLRLTHHSWNNDLVVTWYGAKSIDSAPDDLQVLYNIKKLPPAPTSSTSGGWEGLKQLERQLQWDSHQLANLK